MTNFGFLTYVFVLQIPVDSIDLIMRQYRVVADDSLNPEGLSVTHDLPARISSSIREYLCYKAYLVMYHSKNLCWLFHL
jgi:hypothetical protein